MHAVEYFELSVCVLFLFTIQVLTAPQDADRISLGLNLERLDEDLILMIEVIVQKRAMNICVAAVCEYL